jgi:hypothetical protein
VLAEQSASIHTVWEALAARGRARETAESHPVARRRNLEPNCCTSARSERESFIIIYLPARERESCCGQLSKK